ncbi:hypothetical protein PMAYCL1PPCAC_26561, partial [Pristionchus mayeri]
PLFSLLPSVNIFPMGSSTSTNRLRTANSTKRPTSETRKILVLGCMGAGKTTLCRMLAKTAKARMPPNRIYKHTIENNLLDIFKAIYTLARQYKIPGSENFKEDMRILVEFRHREDLAQRAVEVMRRLLRTNLFAELMKDKRRILELPYNAPYFMQNALRILDEKFEPNDVDIISHYALTVGVNFNSIELGAVKWELFELPGHHIFRRCWHEYYANTNVIIFVVDLSDICRSAFYRGGHLQDKVRQILLKVTMSPLLHQTSFILLFNKKDLLEEIGQGFNFQQLGAGVKNVEAAEKWHTDQCISAVPPTNAVYNHSMSLTKKSDMNSTLFDFLDQIFQSGVRSVDLE